MRKNRKRDHVFLRYCIWLLMYALLLALVHSPSHKLQVLMMGGGAVLLWLLACSRFALGIRPLSIAAGALALVLLCCALPARIIGRRERIGLASLDGAPQESYFSDRNVMLIVPHQDDDPCMLGGVIERFARHGRIRVVFTTNGDYNGRDYADARLPEAIAALALCGVPEEDVIFLGYGDGVALGNAQYPEPDAQIFISHIGQTETYGLDTHPPFRTHANTRANFKTDLRDVILTYRPDTIFCVDNDAHADHRATSMLFEEVMGQILAASDAYQPLVYKGYAYLAWEAQSAAGEENLISTRVSGTGAGPMPDDFFLWEQRFRLPVSSVSSTRITSENLLHQMIACYRVPNAMQCVGGIVRGDKVVWRRRTDAIRTGVTASADSGDAALLTDFRLADKRGTLWGGFTPLTDGVWTPAPADGAAARIDFDVPRTVSRVVLYDSPSLADNVLEAEIAFSDGTRVTTGPLHENGAATETSFPAREVDWFTVTLKKTQGERPGLAEIEAFAGESPMDRPLVKLMDEDGDFCYDYRLDGTGTFYLLEQNVGANAPVADRYTLSLTRVRGEVSAVMDETGAIRVTCADGARCVLRVANREDASLYDEVLINHPEAEPWLVRLYAWSKAYRHDGFLQRQVRFYVNLYDNAVRALQEIRDGTYG